MRPTFLNSGHTATLRSAKIRQSQTSYVRRMLCEIAFKKEEWEENCHLNCTLVGKEGS